MSSSGTPGPWIYECHVNSILFGDTMVPNIEEDFILLLVIIFHIRNIILLGFYSCGKRGVGPRGVGIGEP